MRQGASMYRSVLLFLVSTGLVSVPFQLARQGRASLEDPVFVGGQALGRLRRGRPARRLRRRPRGRRPSPPQFRWTAPSWMSPWRPTCLTRTARSTLLGGLRPRRPSGSGVTVFGRLSLLRALEPRSSRTCPGKASSPGRAGDASTATGFWSTWSLEFNSRTASTSPRRVRQPHNS